MRYQLLAVFRGRAGKRRVSLGFDTELGLRLQIRAFKAARVPGEVLRYMVVTR